MTDTTKRLVITHSYYHVVRLSDGKVMGTFNRERDAEELHHELLIHSTGCVIERSYTYHYLEGSA